jgi:zeta-carotene desaturase
MPSVTVVGAGLSGLAATAALADSGFDVDVFEARPWTGGRATSYSVPLADGQSDIIDNSQHILLRCCVNLLDFYRRLGVSGAIEFHREFYFLERGGQTSVFRAGRFPHPAHFSEAFLALKFLSIREKIALVRGVLALRSEHGRRPDLDQITMLDWLKEKHQPERVIDRFWHQVLVSAINEELDTMAASHGFQVFALGFLGTTDSYEMGVPSVSLGALYDSAYWQRWPNVRFHFRHPVSGLNGGADLFIVAVPFERVGNIVPGYQPPPMEHSPITGVHLWFDRSITALPHATLLDSPLHWVFNKGAGRQLQVVISASRAMTSMSRGEIVDLAVGELKVYFPEARTAQLLRARVVKEVRATFSATPGLTSLRPAPATHLPNVFVAGDWTRTGWPSTMEGAVRSGYAAAEAVAAAAGRQFRFLVPEINDRSSTLTRYG